MSNKEIQEWNIWIGKHPGADSPVHVASVQCRDFETACFIYELQSTLEVIVNIEESGEVMHRAYRIFNYQHQDNSNRITGKYYSSEEEAAKSFEKKLIEVLN